MQRQNVGWGHAEEWENRFHWPSFRAARHFEVGRKPQAFGGGSSPPSQPASFAKWDGELRLPIKKEYRDDQR